MTDAHRTDATLLRLRALLDGRVEAALALCLLAAAVGGALAYQAHLDPPTAEQERTVGTWTVGTEYEHGAVVTEPTSLFENGTELTDRRTYFRRVAPELDGTAVTTYRAGAAENVTVRMESRLVVRGVDSEDAGSGSATAASEGERVLWSRAEPLGERRASDVSPGEPVSLSFAVNATEIAQRLDRIDRELGAVPGDEEAFVETDVVVTGEVQGERVRYERTAVLDVAIRSDAYTVTERGTGSETIPRTEFVTVERDVGPLRGVGGPALLVGGLGLGGALAVARRDDRIGLSARERERLAYLDDRAEYDAWISRIDLPPAARQRPTARAASLADLVDFAIDADAGVIEDPETGACHVLAGGLRYTYAPPGVEATEEAGADSATAAQSLEAVRLSANGDGPPVDDRVDDGRSSGEQSGDGE